MARVGAARAEARARRSRGARQKRATRSVETLVADRGRRGRASHRRRAGARAQLTRPRRRDRRRSSQQRISTIATQKCVSDPSSRVALKRGENHRAEGASVDARSMKPVVAAMMGWGFRCCGCLVLPLPRMRRGEREEERDAPRHRRTSIATTRAAPTEAPTGFDGVSNGLTDPTPPSAHDKAAFDSAEDPDEGLGPLYNAQACRECHQITDLGRGESDHGAPRRAHRTRRHTSSIPTFRIGRRHRGRARGARS